MDLMQKTILVPWDFTPLSEKALLYAIQIAKVVNNNITLLHIAETKKDVASRKQMLDKVAAKVTSDSGIQASSRVEIGSIFKSIAVIASDPDISLAIMKTDGVKGMQKYTGSKAIKIMRGAKAPFIVVQDTPQNKTFERVVYPIDFRTENKELLSYILYLSKLYQSKLYLYKMQTSDTRFKKNITNNINYVRLALESKHIDYEIVSADSNKDFSTGVNDFAKSVNADLIMVQLQRNLTLTKFLFGVKEQGIIANPYKIPVMCVNPLDLTVYGGFR
jgi:nucleotide-binding universal stress UspA family protein